MTRQARRTSGSGAAEVHNKRGSALASGPQPGHGSFASSELASDDYHSPRPPAHRGSLVAALAQGSPAKRRQSRFVEATAGPSGSAELPPIDSARDGKSSTSRPP